MERAVVGRAQRQSSHVSVDGPGVEIFPQDFHISVTKPRQLFLTVDEGPVSPKIETESHGRGDKFRGHDTEWLAQGPKDNARQTERNHIHRHEDGELQENLALPLGIGKGPDLVQDEAVGGPGTIGKAIGNQVGHTQETLEKPK